MDRSGIQVTVDLYGRLVPGSNRQTVEDRLDDERVVKLAATKMQPSRLRTQKQAKKGPAISAGPLISLVAGTGFEPVTFGL
jgi:hypothetical protein